MFDPIDLLICCSVIYIYEYSLPILFIQTSSQPTSMLELNTPGSMRDQAFMGFII
jgi:hypothetical protein